MLVPALWGGVGGVIVCELSSSVRSSGLKLSPSVQLHVSTSAKNIGLIQHQYQLSLGNAAGRGGVEASAGPRLPWLRPARRSESGDVRAAE